MKKYRFLYFLFLLLFCTSLSARDIETKCNGTWPIYTLILNSKTITIVPSNHVEIFNLCPNVLLYLANFSKEQTRIAIEADIEDLGKKSTEMLHGKIGWSDEFSQKSTNSAEKLLNHVGANSDTLKYVKSLKPIFSQFALAQFALVGLIEASGPSIDARATEIAKLNNVSISYLETAEDQFHAMEQVSITKINKGVEDIHDFYSCYECREKYYSAWKDVVEKFSVGGLKNAENSWNLLEARNYPLTPVDRELIEMRNEFLVKKIVESSANGVTLFYIGAGHFWGDKSIISILRKKTNKIDVSTLLCYIVSEDGIGNSDLCSLH